MTRSLLPGWTAADVPDQSGRRAVVTGANSGLGLATATALARAGAHVVLTARDDAKADAAVRHVRGKVPGAEVESDLLDLADLASVRAFAGRQGATPLHLLVNNAGVMAVPQRETVDGFELQLATNHLGPFALTGLLLPALLQAPGARVVTVSSFMHWLGRLDLADLHGRRRYDPWTAYNQSKLANLLFTRELARRARLAGADLASLAAHPGYTLTNLQRVGPRMAGSRLAEAVMSGVSVVVGQRPEVGVLPQLKAATDPGVENGGYLGPRGLEVRGLPHRAPMSRAAQDDAAALALWEASEELTGVRYDALAQLPKDQLPR